MNKLDFSVSLWAKGLSSEEVESKMKEKGFEDSEIQYYLKKSEEIFLNQSINYKGLKSKGKSKNIIRTIALVLTFILLIGVLLGYVKIGILGLVILWGMVSLSTYKR